MRRSVDVRVVDWGIAGHELPFITNVVSAFRNEALTVAVSLPSHVGNLDSYRSLSMRFAKDDQVIFEQFNKVEGPARPRRLHKFLTSFLTNLSIRTKSDLFPRLGCFYTTVNPYFDPQFGTTQYILGNIWASHILHPSTNANSISVECVKSLGALNTCRGLGLTDERLVSPTNERFRGSLKSFQFPEFADLSVSRTSELRHRPRCLLIGALSSYKNVMTFLELAKLSPSVDFYLVGTLSRDQYPESELRSIDDLVQLRNVVRIDRYLSDGPEFNDYIYNADAVWLNYRSFEHSSNVQIKANAFGIPCMLAGSGLVYHRRKLSDFVCTSREGMVEYLASMKVLSKQMLGSEFQSDARRIFIDGLTDTYFLR
jgi:glycosyltransferase involved in cell wall biosynthesis